ncbi:MAG: rhodanese-like domain-containing protein [Vulcanimicrobiaceae bacterium]
MREISVEECAAWRSSGRPFTLLDVREPDEVATATLAGAMHIPMAQIPARLSEVPRDQEVVVMCHHGARSERIVRFLEANGFTEAINLEGGIDAWSQRIDPTIPGY